MSGTDTGEQPHDTVLVVGDWPLYQSHRIISALPIVAIGEATGDGTARVLFVDPAGTGAQEPFLTTVPAMVDKANVGDYAMRYPDGFQSVCPKAAFEDGYSVPAANATEPPSDEPAHPMPPAPQIGLMVHELDDGTCGVHAIVPDGTEHSITMPANHGALLAFKLAVLDWLERLGSRATAWEKTPPEAHDGQAPDQT